MKKMAIILPKSHTIENALSIAKKFNMHVLQKDGRFMVTHLPPSQEWKPIEQLTVTIQ